MAAMLLGCSKGSGSPGAGSTAPNAFPATLEGPITAGTITPPLDPRFLDLEAVGYVAEASLAAAIAGGFIRESDRDAYRAELHKIIIPD